MINKNIYNIVIIEPSPVLQQGLRDFLDSDSDLNVLHCFSDLQSFQENKKDKVFDIILINPSVVNFYKQFAIKSILSEYNNIIIVAILYGYVDSETISSFDGSLDIYDEATMIIKKLKKIIENSINHKEINNTDNVELSDREKEILVSVARGLTNKEIADKHFISIHTVISHRKNITQKTGIKTVSGLTIYAVFNNLISQEELL